MNTILIIILCLVGVYVLAWFFNRTKALTTFAPADTLQTIPVTSIPSSTGYNYAYSVWIYVNDWSYKYGSDKMIFIHGSNGKHNPSLILEPLDNNAKVLVNMENSEIFECEIQDIPLQRWTNILITMNTKSLDSYINGKLVKTCVLPSPPLVDTTSPVYITPSGGFSGFTSKFNYWNDSVNPQQAWNVYKKGPGGNFLTSFFKQYKIQLSFLKGSDVQASLTI